MNASQHLTRMLGVLVLAGMVACTARPESDESGGMTAAQSDPVITASIQSKYFTDDVVKGLDIDVDTEDGVVTLEGTLESDAAKARAVDLAQNTEGVSRVEDRLMVRDPAMAEREAERVEGVNPGWITTKIESKYFLDPDVKGRNIDVTTANNGTVTLRGRVDDARARQQAVALARDTEGVAGVEDQLTLNPDPAEMAEPAAAERDVDTSADPAMNDGWITTKIQASYFIDADVKGRDIDVTTQNGIVTLTGTVSSETERREAAAIARDITGVVEVREQLRVMPTEDVAEAAREADDSEMPLTDAWLTTKIQAQYFADPDVSSLDINVTTQNRIVTLEGEVESTSEKTLAESIARDTDGVTRVISRLVVANADGR